MFFGKDDPFRLSFGWMLTVWAGLVFLCPAVQAQNANRIPLYFDSLSRPATVLKKLEWYKELSFDYSVMNPDSGVFFGKKALQLALENKLAAWEAHAANSIGYCFIKKGVYDSASTYLHRALGYYRTAQSACDIAGVDYNFGTLYYSMGNLAEALDAYSRYEEASLQCPDFLRENPGGAAHAIGIIYNAQGLHEKAIPFFQKALAANEKGGMENRAADNALSLGNAFLGLKKYPDAFRYYARAEALYTRNDNQNGMGLTAENQGIAFREQGNYPAAVAQFRRAYALFVEMKSSSDQCFELQQLGDIYARMGRYDQSIEAFTAALKLAQENGFVQLLPDLHLGISKTYEQSDNFRMALYHHQIASRQQDSLNLAQQQARLDELTTRYEARQKDKEIELLSRANRLQEEKASQQRTLRNVLLAGLALVIVLALVLLNRYQLKQKTARALEEKNEVIEQQKLRAERGEQFRQRFLQRMSHEIRTPLHALTGMIRILQGQPSETATRRYLDAMTHTGNDLMAIVNEVLDFAKLEAGKTDLAGVPFSPEAVISRVWESLRPAALKQNLQYTLHLNPHLPTTVCGDPVRLGQVLMNLLGNAIKFTAKGEVSLSVSVENPSPALSPGRHWISFAVTDTGAGIAPEQQEALFEEFTQVASDPPTAWAGTGLGLAIARELVQRMGGTLALQSEAGKGSRFYFTLPFTPTDQVPEPAEAPLPASTFPVRVWVVEDYGYNALVTGDILRKYFPAGEVREFESAEAFLDALAGATPALPHLVLLDLNLPGLSGIAAARQVRERFSLTELPLVAHTASLLPGNQDALPKEGFNATLLKPYPEAALIRLIHGLVPQTAAATQSEKVATPALAFPDLFIRLVPPRLTTVIHARGQKDWKTVQATVHLMRPQLMDAGMTADAALFEAFEYFDAETPDEIWEEHTARFIERVQAKLTLHPPDSL